MNAWDSRHIEEPAFETRQEGYAAASEMVVTETRWSTALVLPILHNAIFTLNTVRNSCFWKKIEHFLFLVLFVYRVWRCLFAMQRRPL